MSSLLKLEINIALLPEPRLANSLVKASWDIARRHNAVIRLGIAGPKLSLVPHLTLYQAAFSVERIPTLDKELARATHGERSYDLTSIGLSYNEEEGSVEDGKEITDSLVTLQERVIFRVNSLRDGLLVERDPAGNNVADLLHARGRLGENIRDTGYGEVGDPRIGGLFRPHDTLNWLSPNTQVDIAYEQSLLSIADMSGSYSAIGLFVMGPYGTCAQLLRRYDLTA
jgi:hypothetical protein